jgi:hypothetical protein
MEQYTRLLLFVVQPPKSHKHPVTVIKTIHTLAPCAMGKRKYCCYLLFQGPKSPCNSDQTCTCLSSLGIGRHIGLLQLVVKPPLTYACQKYTYLGPKLYLPWLLGQYGNIYGKSFCYSTAEPLDPKYTATVLKAALGWALLAMQKLIGFCW